MKKKIGIDQATFRFAGIMILSSLLLSSFIDSRFVYITWFVGFMLLQSSFTKFCPPALLFKKLGFKSISFF
jgi:hypothetical protein